MKTNGNRLSAGTTVRLSTLLLGCALMASGCVRTPDGTVTVAKELDVGRYWRPPPQPPQTPPIQSGTEVFPVAPEARWSKPARRTYRATRKAAAVKPLACHNEIRQGQRARVVCE